ncbi:hypothetical protein [Burkholderia latens]|uniref:Uncharacterized protein n=1 Tax=Burkholderia latens TaxID=488446 RepID=A0A6H9T3L1_9BURK|nr:hypothetical protein [Burkholderia latens]KAB0631547.1 hypothetical protein F7R21_31410 [Burkholderia latens]
MLDQALGGAASARLSVLQGEFWPNGIYAGISEVAYAMQDLSVNRVGIFPTTRIETRQTAGQVGRESVCNVVPHGTNPAKDRPAKLPEIESVKIIVVFHNSATIVAGISLHVCAPFLSGFSRISSCNKP